MSEHERADPAERELEAELELARDAGSVRLWFGVLAGPVGWALALMVSYPLVPASCVLESMLPLIFVTVLTGALIAAGGVIAWRCQRSLTRRLGPGDMWRSSTRAELMATGGIVLSALFFLTTIGHAAAMLFVGPCF